MLSHSVYHCDESCGLRCFQHCPGCFFPWKLDSCHLFLQGFPIRCLNITHFSAEAIKSKKKIHQSWRKSWLIGFQMGSVMKLLIDLDQFHLCGILILTKKGPSGCMLAARRSWGMHRSHFTCVRLKVYQTSEQRWDISVVVGADLPHRWISCIWGHFPPGRFFSLMSLILSELTDYLCVCVCTRMSIFRIYNGQDCVFNFSWFPWEESWRSWFSNEVHKFCSLKLV